MRTYLCKGQVVFDAQLGFGRSLLVDAGMQVVSQDRRGKIHVRGSWAMQATTSWRVRRGRETLIGSADELAAIEPRLEVLLGARVLSVVVSPCGDCTVFLSGNRAIDAFVDCSDLPEPWVLWTSPTRTRTFRPRSQLPATDGREAKRDTKT